VLSRRCGTAKLADCIALNGFVSWISDDHVDCEGDADRSTSGRMARLSLSSSSTLPRELPCSGLGDESLIVESIDCARGLNGFLCVIVSGWYDTGVTLNRHDPSKCKRKKKQKTDACFYSINLLYEAGAARQRAARVLGCIGTLLGTQRTKGGGSHDVLLA
jgi:hypothetical protein